MPWDPAHKKIVTDMWVTGCGSARIIEALAAVGKAATKNAVVCEAYRAELAFQGARTKPPAARPARVPMTPEERAEKERQRAARRRVRDAATAGRPVPPPRPRIVPAGVPLTMGIPIPEIRDCQCLYIADDPVRDAPATCCGHATVPGSSWCPWHWTICTAPAQRAVSMWVPDQRRVA